MFSTLLAWPDQLQDPAWQDPRSLICLATLIRLQRFAEAEATILAGLAGAQATSLERQYRMLLVVLRLYQRQIDAAAEQLVLLADDRSAEGRFLQVQLWLEQQQSEPLERLPGTWWDGESQFLPLAVSHVAWLLQVGRHAEAEQRMAGIQRPHCLELVRFQARLCVPRGDYQQAVDLLLSAARRFPQHRGLQAETASLLIDARSREHTIPFLRQALEHHGDLPDFMESVARVKLLQREPAQARRCALQQQVFASVHPMPCNPAGVVVAYEQTGYSHWMPYLHPYLQNQPVQTSAVQHNLCLYLASTEAPGTQSHVVRQVERLTELPEFCSHAQAGPPPRPALLAEARAPLTVAWLTGDLGHHPVSRFLLGFLQAGSARFAHRHLLVDLKDHASESVADRFDGIPGLQRLNVGNLPPDQKLAAIREQQVHVAIDLSGWTDGNFVTGFMARMAPVQINYLGYFASTGIPAMDAWLGDAQLFPTPMREWHSEQIARLSRCFIAWQPPQILPEATAQIADAPRACGIRFGSFNHNRKLSDPTLRLWGRILQYIPDAQLVLKANQIGDEATQVLLRRRMQRQGLDPERVVWLPIAPGPQEHLAQYGEMDVALDCFPNGGCTTTCEALWMGVPVITLTGHSYVSRMSTAVLHGAGLPQLCATNEEEYLRLALEQAANLTWLRQHRHHWRHQVQSHPLGDAADLMQHLEGAFRDLYRSVCSRSSASP